MEKMVNEAKFCADLEHLHQIIQWVRKRAERCAFSKKDLFHIELATEEAVVNIIRHGYGQKGGSIEIKIVIGDSFLIEIYDEAPPFDPLKKRPVKDLTQIGGMGIDLLFQCMNQVTYQRKGSYNILALKKAFPTSNKTKFDV
jgi:anti-sigma regulatory factor (Ser/Thr protein kinase)